MQLFYTDFNSYVADHPEAESFRNFCTREMGVPLEGPVKRGRKDAGFEIRISPIRIIKNEGSYSMLDGGYSVALIGVRKDDWRKEYADGWSFYVYVDYADDSCIMKGHLSWEAALQELNDLCELAPIDPADLVFAFGYEIN